MIEKVAGNIDVTPVPNACIFNVTLLYELQGFTVL